jgi:hypothetical protein
MARCRSFRSSLAVAACVATSGCGAGIIALVITLGTGGGGGGGGGRVDVRVQGSVESLVLAAGTDGCVNWNTAAGCSGQLCDLTPGTTVQVTCDDPILAEWPDAWTLQSATWSAPALQAAGTIVVEPAASYAVHPQHGSIVTDTGFSAYVMHLDVASLAPAEIDLAAVFDRGTDLIDCVKGVRVTTVEVLPAGVRFIVPADPAGLDFTALAAPDPHVYCVESPIAVDASSWSRVKCRYR